MACIRLCVMSSWCCIAVATPPASQPESWHWMAVGEVSGDSVRGRERRKEGRKEGGRVARRWVGRR